MKTTLLSLTLLVHFTAKSQTPTVPPKDKQTFKCVYKLSYRPDSTSSSLRTEEMILSITNTTSRFESRGSQLRDSLAAANQTLPTTREGYQVLANKMMSFPRTKFRYIIQKEYASKQLGVYDRVGTTVYHYTEPSSVAAWKITPIKAVISGYTCQKATTTYGGRLFEAWFSREVPVSDGPYKFNGLPGLIIKVSDTKNNYSFELITITKSTSSAVLPLPSKAVLLTTKPQLYKAQLAYELSLTDRVAAMGNQISEEDKNAARLKALRFNNPLELK